MLISNEMRNEPALALRLINGKITPSRQLNEVLYSCLFLVCFSLTTKSLLIKQQNFFLKCTSFQSLAIALTFFYYYYCICLHLSLAIIGLIRKIKAGQESLYLSLAHVFHLLQSPTLQMAHPGPLARLNLKSGCDLIRHPSPRVPLPPPHWGPAPNRKDEPCDETAGCDLGEALRYFHCRRASPGTWMRAPKQGA